MISLKHLLFGLLRIGMGWIFLWAFLDKTFGLGFSTATERAWLAGGSPTTGFLSNATSGPFMDIFKGLAGNPFVDWLFMIGLLCIGLSLIFGVGMRIAVCSGIVMMALMYLATLPTENNPFVDDHVVYGLVLLLLGVASDATAFMSFGKWWASTELVKKYPILK